MKKPLTVLLILQAHSLVHLKVVQLKVMGTELPATSLLFPLMLRSVAHFGPDWVCFGLQTQTVMASLSWCECLNCSHKLRVCVCLCANMSACVYVCAHMCLYMYVWIVYACMHITEDSWNCWKLPVLKPGTRLKIWHFLKDIANCLLVCKWTWICWLSCVDQYLWT